jgi:hypothetical protein
MPRNTYAENIKSAEVMSAGLLNNAEQAAKSGLSEEFTQGLNSDLRAVVSLNNEQERLKADLKEKSEELAARMTSLNAALSLARKKIKIDFPQARWVEFGISAKR